MTQHLELPETSISPLLGRHVLSEYGLGIITFRSHDATPIYGCTWSEHPTVYGTALVLLERGVKLLPGRSELMLFPSRVNGEPGLEGLASCEFAARREIGRLEMAAA